MAGPWGRPGLGIRDSGFGIRRRSATSRRQRCVDATEARRAWAFATAKHRRCPGGGKTASLHTSLDSRFPIPDSRFPIPSTKNTKARISGLWCFCEGGSPRQRYSGTRISYYRCSLPGLAGFAAYRRGGTNGSHHSYRWVTAGVDGSAAAWRAACSSDRAHETGGERGIRTLDTGFSRIHTFQACSLNRSDTSPGFHALHCRARRLAVSRWIHKPHRCEVGPGDATDRRSPGCSTRWPRAAMTAPCSAEP
jgi:hypothetical protein